MEGTVNVEKAVDVEGAVNGTSSEVVAPVRARLLAISAASSAARRFLAEVRKTNYWNNALK